MSNSASWRNRYDRLEWAGAFGDLGTLLPFVAAYIGVVGMDPLAVLFAFGAGLVACGLRYRTPVPVQPMKAVGAVAAVQAAQAGMGPGAVQAAALATGLAWLLVSASSSLVRLMRRVPQPVVAAVVLGVALSLSMQALVLVQRGWLAALAAGALALLLRRNRVLPAMFALLLLGAGVGAWQQPALVDQLLAAPVGWRAPQLALGELRWDHLLMGTVLLALPQMPLTLGNAIIALREEHNRRFPQRPVDERQLARSTGWLNLLSGSIGGVPMCHGVGGLASHMAFGARTGGAVVILGCVLLALALFFSAGVGVLFQLFAPPVLGVMLLLGAWQLAHGARWPEGRSARTVVAAGAVACAWNVAAGFLVAWLLHLVQQRWARRRRVA